MKPNWNDVEVPIPPSEKGIWKIEEMTLTEKDVSLHNIRQAFKPSMGNRCITPGTYKRLLRQGGIFGFTTIMSTTPAEVNDLWGVYDHAKGDVLINGLGLGVVVFLLLKKEEVTSITVIEIDQDVIDLVEPYIKDPRVTVIHADAFTWKPPKGKRYNAVWHDIWDYICGDNLPEMHKLHRRYGKRTDWQGSWCRDLCELNR